MSQRRTGGRRTGTPSRASHDFANQPSEEEFVVSPQSRRGILSESHHKIAASIRRGQRPLRESGVHAILNPNTSPQTPSPLPTTDLVNRRDITPFAARSSYGQRREHTGTPSQSGVQSTALDAESISVQRSRAFAQQQALPAELISRNFEQPPGSTQGSSALNSRTSYHRAPLFAGRTLVPMQTLPLGSPKLQSLDTGSSDLEIGQIPGGPPPNMHAYGPSTSTYQYMTLETESGPVSFPVDVQAASRTAAEKRQRNAGASARFRARRKERESASVRELDELRQQIRDLEEDVEFYRSERDYLAHLRYEGRHREGHFPRPVSPRHRRSVRPQVEMSFGSLSGRESFQEPGELDEHERLTRRRLSGPTFGVTSRNPVGQMTIGSVQPAEYPHPAQRFTSSRQSAQQIVAHHFGATHEHPSDRSHPSLSSPEPALVDPFIGHSTDR